MIVFGCIDSNFNSDQQPTSTEISPSVEFLTEQTPTAKETPKSYTKSSNINEEYYESQGWKIHTFRYENNGFYIPIPTIYNPNIQSIYKYYTSQPRKYRDYTYYSIIDADVGKVYADYFTEYAQENNYDEWEKVSLVLAFVQSLPYTSDSVTTGYDEYPRFPIETLVDNGGDCEDTSILLASILRHMGYNTVLIELSDHMAVGVAISEEVITDWNQDYSLIYYSDEFGNIYAYAETTGSGYKIGQIPKEYEKSRFKIYYLIPHPIINYAWEAQLISYNSFWATYTIQLLLENEGSENAENMYIWYGSDAGNDKFYSQIMSDPFDIPQNSQYVGTATLTVPRGVVTQFNIKIWGDNIEPIEIYSDILET
jgi:predicted transglutaminase-like cysteine proteinase